MDYQIFYQHLKTGYALVSSEMCLSSFCIRELLNLSNVQLAQFSEWLAAYINSCHDDFEFWNTVSDCLSMVIVQRFRSFFVKGF